MRDNAKKRQDIKESALRLFAEKGVDGVSVRDIAADLGMTPANLYGYFSSKEALAAEIFHEGYGHYGDLLAGIAAGPIPFFRKLELIVDLICRLHDEDNLRFRFLLMTQHGYIHDVARDMRNPVEVICRVVADAMETGEIAKDDPDVVALALIGVLVQPATGLLYGRVAGTLSERAGLFLRLCSRLLSLDVSKFAPVQDTPQTPS